ncbi:phytase [Oscillatoria sp. CS-180]|uniref:phytase n=1 Tax=Oscillatoria sp. CS-180 TaxID=3021720 RepID=UPI00232AFE3F|nr:phytase [Oscillatoria sp. CS-180]MDB9528963.1 phytase [Oscillatoria sp. CS-180]
MSTRFASFNASLNRSEAEQLIMDLSTPENEQAQAIAEIIQRTNPDVLLINEFDFDADGEAARLFQENYLSVSQNGVDPIEYSYVYVAPSNTGIPSGFDLDNSGAAGDFAPNDAFGFGFFEGQFAFAIFSKFPIVEDEIRTFQEFLWKDMPGALLPTDPEDVDGNGDTENWYTAEELEVVRLSSKNHVDVPIEVDGEIIHVLASHPTPPVFDGPEDRNGTRNFDEIRFWADYVQGADYIYDDDGNTGGLEAGAKFVIMGDQNADPFDGDSIPGAAQLLLDNPLVNTSVTPSSEGGVDAADRQGGANADHLGNPAFDTADFGFNADDPTNDNTPGNLRVDYALPSRNLEITDAQVFWQASDAPLFPLAEFPTSDHRLVSVDVATPEALDGRVSVTGLEFLGEVTFETGFEFEETEVGGLSGLVYDPAKGVYYALADARSDARFYTLTVDLSDGSLEDGDITFTDVNTLVDSDGNPFVDGGIDPEGIALSPNGTLYISSEGDANALLDPFVNEFSLDGQQLAELPVDDKFLPTADQSSGIRNNLAFESLTLSPDGQFLYTATENALFQDGLNANLDNGSLSRIVKYDLESGEAVGEFVYEVDSVPEAPIPDDAFSTNGLVELLATDNNGSLLALERAFSAGQGNTVKLYEVRSQGALNVQEVADLFREEEFEDDGDILPPGPFEIDPAVTKEELLDIEADLGIEPDNLEALAFGPILPDGRQTLIIASDNNFSDTQATQFLAFALETESMPVVPSVLETPLTVDDEDGTTPLLGDSDDPAIWVNLDTPDESRVIITLKDGGLAVLNLAGEIQQTILPAPFGDIRYNNVDVLYDVEVPAFNPNGAITTDLAVVSDRENDTLAVFSINAETGELTDFTAPNLSDPDFSIFGVDDGEATAYGLATYTSPVSGKLYAFVTQADGNQVAQLELIPEAGPADESYIDAKVVRLIDLPVPTGDAEDSQSEGLVVDQELGFLYVALENEVGILKFEAEPNGGSDGELVQAIDTDFFEPDLEGLTLYYSDEGTGYLIASSQGNNSFAVFTREGDNEYLGSFTVGDTGLIDQVNESDGLDVTNVALGSAFPNGLLIVQDGANDPQNAVEDDEELENNSTNFKFVDWADVAAALGLDVDTDGFDPRNPDALVNTLPNGVASGDVSQDSAVLWTRSTVEGEVTFEYSTDADFSSIVGTVTAIATDTDVPVQVDIDGLEVGTEYFYRATNAVGATESGRFVTGAEPGEYTGLTFGISGDWQQAPPYPILNSAADSELDLFVKLGDTIYADLETPALPGVTQARTLEEFRIKHEEILSPRFGLSAVADLQATTSVLTTIDDHEIVDNFAGGAAPGDSPDAPDIGSSPDPLFTDDVEFVNDTQVYEDALQAYQEYQPIREEFYEATGDARTDGERKLYRSRDYGSDASIFVTDSRSFRDDQLEPANIVDPTEFLVQAFDPSRTLLGEAQLELLKADLLAAKENGTTWKFVVIPEPIQNFGVANAEDRFEGYAAERTELLSFIDENEIDNVVFMAGDFHGTIVNNLTYQLGPGQEQVATNAFEIVTGPVAFFDGRFGPSVIDLASAFGLITPEQRAFYDTLPIAPDTDNIPDDKDDFLEQLLIAQTDVLGYDPVGLDNNLEMAEGLIKATLLQGDYVSAHTFSWTELDIDAETQVLTVTTFGIDAYSEADLLADPQAVLDLTPRIVSQFEVAPTVDEVDAIAELIDLTGFDDDVAVNVTGTREAAFDNVLKFYETDAQGRVKGLAPDDDGYEAAVAANLIDGSELFVTNLNTADFDLTLTGGVYYAPALLIDGSTDNLATLADNALGMIRIQREGDVWRFEDLNDNDFNDLVITLNSAEAIA